MYLQFFTTELLKTNIKDKKKRLDINCDVDTHVYSSSGMFRGSLGIWWMILLWQ